MTASGCSYNGGICHETVEACDGCSRKAEYASGWFCSTCPEPDVKWKSGHCNMATHVSRQAAGSKQKINPLKASKRANR
jgi:hypothetical protein